MGEGEGENEKEENNKRTSSGEEAVEGSASRIKRTISISHVSTARWMRRSPC